MMLHVCTHAQFQLYETGSACADYNFWSQSKCCPIGQHDPWKFGSVFFGRENLASDFTGTLSVRRNISDMPQAPYTHDAQPHRTRRYKMHWYVSMHDTYACMQNPDGYLDASPQWEPGVSDMLTHDRELSRIAG